MVRAILVDPSHTLNHVSGDRLRLWQPSHSRSSASLRPCSNSSEMKQLLWVSTRLPITIAHEI